MSRERPNGIQDIPRAPWFWSKVKGTSFGHFYLTAPRSHQYPGQCSPGFWHLKDTTLMLSHLVYQNLHLGRPLCVGNQVMLQRGEGAVSVGGHVIAPSAASGDPSLSWQAPAKVFFLSLLSAFFSCSIAAVVQSERRLNPQIKPFDCPGLWRDPPTHQETSGWQLSSH